MSSGKNRKHAGSVIGADMVITGDVSCTGFLRVEGTIDGSLRGEEAEVAKGGRLGGEINLAALKCAGVVSGRIVADRLELAPDGEISGTVISKELDMARGATLSARTTVVGAGEQLRAERPGPPAGSDNRAVAGKRSPAGSSEPSGVDGSDATPEFRPVVDSLMMALQGGSRLIVIMSEHSETRSQFAREAEARLRRQYLHIGIEDPSGSVRDVLLRIAGKLPIELRDYGDNDGIREDLRAFMNAQAGEKPCLVFIENGEKMYPATLEGLLRHLADGIPPSDMVGLVLLGGGELKKMRELETVGVPLREPDCVFEL